jgi:hypothetical protein
MEQFAPLYPYDGRIITVDIVHMCTKRPAGGLEERISLALSNVPI